jgi:hypothetical protein
MMTDPKVPYWLSPKEFQSLREIMRKEDITGEIAEDIRNEIGVAHIRAKTSRISTNTLIVVLGLSKGSIPLHFSENEVNFLHNLEALPQKVKKRLD